MWSRWPEWINVAVNRQITETAVNLDAVGCGIQTPAGAGLTRPLLWAPQAIDGSTGRSLRAAHDDDPTARLLSDFWVSGSQACNVPDSLYNVTLLGSLNQASRPVSRRLRSSRSSRCFSGRRRVLCN